MTKEQAKNKLIEVQDVIQVLQCIHSILEDYIASGPTLKSIGKINLTNIQIQAIKDRYADNLTIAKTAIQAI